MITKPALLILGMINQEPKGAYEINKLLVQMNVKWWLKISDSSLYSTIRNLEKKGLIKGHIEKNGNMPERTVYEITEEGNKQFIKNIEEAYQTVDFDTTVISIVNIFIDSLDTQLKNQLINQREKILKEYIQGMKANMDKMTPYVNQNVIANINRMKEIIEAELNYIQKFCIR